MVRIAYPPAQIGHSGHGTLVPPRGDFGPAMAGLWSRNGQDHGPRTLVLQGGRTKVLPPWGPRSRLDRDLWSGPLVQGANENGSQYAEPSWSNAYHHGPNRDYGPGWEGTMVLGVVGPWSWMCLTMRETNMVQSRNCPVMSYCGTMVPPVVWGRSPQTGGHRRRADHDSHTHSRLFPRGIRCRQGGVHEGQQGRMERTHAHRLPEAAGRVAGQHLPRMRGDHGRP
jgi:hypothetical protein